MNTGHTGKKEILHKRKIFKCLLRNKQQKNKIHQGHFFKLKIKIHDKIDKKNYGSFHASPVAGRMYQRPTRLPER